MKFLETITVKKFRTILDNIKQITQESEKIPLEQSFNRIVSEDITSSIDVPHFRKSRMDGFAVRAEDTFGAEEDNLVPLELIEIIEAGDKPEKALGKGQCSYVATGAAIPENANAVVMVEYSDREGEIVNISKAVTPNTHVVEVGVDVKKGETILKKGSQIDLPAMGLLSSCGLSIVPVHKKQKVGLISTGNEIVSHDVKKLDVGKIYDVNSIVLKQAIENTGVDVDYLGIVKDNYEELKKKVNKGLESNDILIMSGGTSKGEGDLGPRIIESMDGIELLVHGVKIKPGKPIVFAKLPKKLIFILPGYPTSALSCFYVFVDDFLRKLSGMPQRIKVSQEFELAERIYSPVGRHHFKAVQLKEVDGKQKIFPIKTGSEAISTLFYADGYIEIEELEGVVEKGDKRLFHTF